jgi:predicted transposase YdaD
VSCSYCLRRNSKAKREFANSELQERLVELVERLLIGRFPGLDREAIRMKFKTHDIRESKVWKEAVEEGDTRRLKQIVDTLAGKGKTHEEIAELLDVPLNEIRRLANGQPTARQ